ncbi:MAG: hypothetical protein JWM85_1484 [Acidimicrobiaceae bacterium]|nr:hypothetical protein [Acidimicrobiaceae bacterium]
MASIRLERLLVLGALVGLIVGFYTWTVNTSGSPIVLGQTQGDYYNLLSNAFLHGSLSLLMKPPAALVHLRNPYNPALNGSLAGPFHDLALYHGRFYLAWGPTAALVLFIPWRIFGVGDMSQSMAIVIFSGVGVLFGVLLLCNVVNRYLPRVRLWKLAVATLAIGLSSVLPFLGRRPAQYEVAISSGYCFMWIALYCLVSGTYGERWRTIRVAIGSLAVGLAVLAREDLALLLVVPILLLAREARRTGWRPSGELARRAAPLVVPCALMVVVVLWYNAARFGSPFQFGTKYQLAYVDQSAFNYKLWAIPPGVYYFFVEPVQYSLAFPYAQIGPPPYFPWSVANYAQTEPVGGLLTTTPIVLLLVLAPLLLRKRLQRELRTLVTVSALLGLLIALAIAWGVPGVTMRYEVDFATLLILPALVVWFALTDRETAPWSAARGGRFFSGAVSILSTILVLYGALIGVAVSITGYYDEMRQFDGNAYNRLEAAMSFIPTLITKAMGHPDIAKDVYLCGNGECGTYAAGLSHWSFNNGGTVELDVVSPSGGWNLGLSMFTTTREVPGNKVMIQLDNHVWHTTTTRGKRWVAVPLHSGFNRIIYTVPGKQDVSFYRLTTTRSTRGLLPIR